MAYSDETPVKKMAGVEIVDLTKVDVTDKDKLIILFNWPSPKAKQANQENEPLFSGGLSIDYPKEEDDEDRYWVKKNRFFTIELSQSSEEASCMLHLTLQETSDLMNVLLVQASNMPSPMQTPKRVFDMVEGNDTNTATFSVFHVPIGRDKLPENDPDFNDGLESDFDEPNVMLLASTATWAAVVHIPLSTANAIGNYLMEVIAKFAPKTTYIQ